MRILILIFGVHIGISSVFADVAKPIKKLSDTIKCYQCNAENAGEKDCLSGNVTLLKKFIKPCLKINEGTYAGKEANSCRKVLQNVFDVSSTVRECAYTGDEPVHGKHRTGNKGISLYLYQCFNEDNEKPCNSAPIFGGQLIIVSSLALFLSIFYCLKFTL